MENKENKEAKRSETTREESIKEATKKQIPLRLSRALYQELNAWAADDFRSINGQIEYLLSECVKKRRNEEKG